MSTGTYQTIPQRKRILAHLDDHPVPVPGCVACRNVRRWMAHNPRDYIIGDRVKKPAGGRSRRAK